MSILYTLAIIFMCFEFTKEHNPNYPRPEPIENYCVSFSSCAECKKASSQCDWCHGVGCTHFPNYYCPEKVSLDRTYPEKAGGRFCTEIESNNPMFIPANVRRYIRMPLKIDDLTLYKRHILCEIHLEESILRVKATVSENILYCDSTKLSITRSVSLGYIRLLWGGAEPYSNMVLMIVYRCEFMAINCRDCQTLDRSFSCGWCQEKSACTLLEECRRSPGAWIDKKSLCSRQKKHLYLAKQLNLTF